MKNRVTRGTKSYAEQSNRALLKKVGVKRANVAGRKGTKVTGRTQIPKRVLRPL